MRETRQTKERIQEPQAHSSARIRKHEIHCSLVLIREEKEKARTG